MGDCNYIPQAYLLMGLTVVDTLLWYKSTEVTIMIAGSKNKTMLLFYGTKVYPYPEGITKF